ncbi:uncharacterized protein LOC129599030 [Paramacrobiotus metropolitanus]|uniref:uncharacterized protein LOC129599030 n=1 Tax=Paramacrobiotus metropolitanus TaxID=2943436 RepID=UPI002445D703|nr:uncharacterized protein LOC129599030 [Paramacrobiotus metropolitanus]
MHLYENADRSVYAWNAVDGEIDGRLQHGFVVGLEENGITPPRLIVDFGCPTQEAMPVEYGKIWDCSTYRPTRAREGAAVEALLHDGADRPWKWYPAKMLIPKFKHLDNVALVEVVTGGQTRREMLPRRQIRNRSGIAAKKDLLPVGHFILQTCHVPNGYWTRPFPETTLLLREVERKFKVRLIKVFSQQILFVGRCQEAPLQDEDVARVFEKGKQDSAFYELLHKSTEESDDGEPKRKKPLNVGGRGLPMDSRVLKEVFHSVDTVERQRCRRTCQLWETILTSAELCSDLRVTRQKPSSTPQAVKWDCNYALYACIFKFITPATRTICIRDTEPRFLDMSNLHGRSDALGFIKKILEDAGSRIDRFIVHQRSITIAQPEHSVFWDFGVLFAEMTAHTSQLVSCCERMVWKDYALTLLGTETAPAMEFRIPAAVLIGGRVDEAYLVDLFEKHLLWEGPPLLGQFLYINQGMTSRIAGGAWATKVLQILQDYQSADPRPSAHYPERQWSLDDILGLDLNKLNRFCLRALSHYMSALRG